MSWETMRRAHPWPAERPDVPEDLQGWFGASHEAPLREALGAVGSRPPIVVELGTWKGRSARWWLAQDPRLRLICVDSWSPSETYAGTQHKDLTAVQHVYETCARNLWEHRGRCTLVRSDTRDGLRAIHEHGIQPDLIYVDAGHDYGDVAADIAACRLLFPWAVLVGDDHHHAGVARAVAEAASREAMTVEPGGRYVWRLVEHGTRWAETYEREYGRLPVQGRVVFDWGADWGSTARWFLGRGASRVLASEILPRDAERLTIHARVEPRIEALSGINDAATLAGALARCAVAKVDVEGAERLLLDVAPGVIEGVESWVMETHSPALNEALRERFEDIGFRWETVRTFKNTDVRVICAERRP